MHLVTISVYMVSCFDDACLGTDLVQHIKVFGGRRCCRRHGKRDCSGHDKSECLISCAADTLPQVLCSCVRTQAKATNDFDNYGLARIRLVLNALTPVVYCCAQRTLLPQQNTEQAAEPFSVD